jgi:hypothetical protein
MYLLFKLNPNKNSGFMRTSPYCKNNTNKRKKSWMYIQLYYKKIPIFVELSVGSRLQCDKV